jgi:hypothetical protein
MRRAENVIERVAKSWQSSWISIVEAAPTPRVEHPSDARELKGGRRPGHVVQIPDQNGGAASLFDFPRD